MIYSLLLRVWKLFSGNSLKEFMETSLCKPIKEEKIKFTSSVPEKMMSNKLFLTARTSKRK